MAESVDRRPRVLSWFTLLSVSLLGFLCATSEGQDHQPANGCVGCEQQEVILIRGGLGYWPRVQWMADEFSNRGYVPTIIQHWEYPFVAKRIARAIFEGRRSSEINIVGYSSGADAACLLARRLERYGLRVKTMVLIDSTLGTPVPANVDYCENFYISRMMDIVPFFRGVSVEAESPNTVLMNYDLGGAAEFEDVIKRNHLFFGSTIAIREMTVQVVESRQNTAVRSPAETVIGNLPDRTIEK